MPTYPHDLNRRPARIASRPNPSQWGREELLTLDEAAALCWPEGPITVRTLRTAVRDGVLGVAWIAGKVFTSLEALEDMSRCRTKPAPPEAATEAAHAAPAAPKGQPGRNAATEALLAEIAAQKARLGTARRLSGAVGTNERKSR
jgi:hypothetical protein